MNGIKMSDCKFYVNEEKRAVICVIPNTGDILEDFIREHFTWNDINIWASLYGKLYQAIVMPNSFIGKAVCAEGDEWNEETGRIIAFSRAKNKCYKSFFKRANTLIQTFDRRLGDMVDEFNDFGLKLDNKREMLQAEIDHRIKAE